MFQKLMKTSDDFVVTLLRLALGAVFFAHGAQKALGLFGGFGFRGTLGFFTQQMHIPAALAVLAIVICLAIMIRGSGALSIDRSASRDLA